MPHAIIGAISAVGTWVAGATANVLVAAGVGVNTAFAIAHAAGFVAEALIYTAASAGAAALAAPDVPTSEAGKTALQQTMPKRQYVLAESRLSGPFMLYEANKVAHDIYAIADQRLYDYVGYWLHDDKVTLTGNAVNEHESGAYSGGRVNIFTRLGLPTETSYTTDAASFLDDLPTGTWTSSHRGDGIASVYMAVKGQSQEKFHWTFPNGAPVLSVAARPRIYDWRKDSTVAGGSGSHRINDISTWEPSDNPFVLLAHYLTGYQDSSDDPGKLARWNRRVLPYLASWTQAAADCDGTVALAAGGTEKRYRAKNLWHYASTHPAEVIGKLLEACDGWMMEAGDGGFTVQAGYYRAPTVTLGDGPNDLIDLVWNEGRPSEQSANAFPFTWMSVEHGYAQVPGDEWENEADILALGDKRSKAVAFHCVPSHSQGRRLLKRMDLRSNPLAWGTAVFSLAGMCVLGERYFTLVDPDGVYTDETGVVVEIVGAPRMNFGELRVEVDFIVPDVTKLNAWDPATEEGVAPDAETVTPVEEPIGAAPSITGVTQHETFNKAVIQFTGFTDMHKVAARWRQTGETTWSAGAPATPTDEGAGEYSVLSGFLMYDTPYELSIAGVDADDNYTEWADPPSTITLVESGGGA